MIEKIHRTMETLIRSDQSLMASYKDDEEKKIAKQWVNHREKVCRTEHDWRYGDSKWSVNFVYHDFLLY